MQPMKEVNLEQLQKFLQKEKIAVSIISDGPTVYGIELTRRPLPFRLWNLSNNLERDIADVIIAEYNLTKKFINPKVSGIFLASVVPYKCELDGEMSQFTYNYKMTYLIT